jgi:hypothetical protein
MQKAEAISRWMGSDMEDLVYQYQDSDHYCVVHDTDPDLWEVWIPLPEPPAWDRIDGFGLNPIDQVFTRRVIPRDVMELEGSCETLDDIWDELKASPGRYREVIQFIQREIWHELNGYWFFCNGKPTYIPGHMYVYLNYWRGDEGYLQYRDRDRKWFLFQEYMERLNNFLGMNAPKPRRCGDTTKASCVNYMRTIKKRNVNCGMQSATLSHAEEVFVNHIVSPWTELPFWLKPLYDGTSNPKEKLSFVPPAKQSRTSRVTGRKGSILVKDRGLGSKVVFRSSAEKAFDTFKMWSYHGDEVGKTTESDIYKRYYIIRPSMVTGSKINGNVIHTSTVEEQTKAGGENFMKLCKDSMFEQQYVNPSGRTTSWLANLFLPADEGLAEFVGKYGESIKDTPTASQVEFMRQAYPTKSNDDLLIGATEYLLRERRSLEMSKNYVGLNDAKRMYPLFYRECWVRADSDNGMPLHVIEPRVNDLSLMFASQGNIIRTGRFVRVSQRDSDSDVMWVDDRKGPFEVSFLFPEESMANKRVKSVKGWTPSRTDFGIAGADDFSAKKTEGSRMSDGGGAVFMYKTSDDDQQKDIATWEGHRFICLYKHRPGTTEEWGEDMLMMCQYYGVLFFPENNLYVAAKHFEDRGYGGYLKYEVDSKTKRFKKNCGWANTGDNPQRLWRKLRDYFTLHAGREMHLSLLKDALDIPGIEKLTDYDRFVAAGSCLMGAEDFSMENIHKARERTIDIRKFYTNNKKLLKYA